MKILIAGDFAPRNRIKERILKEDYSFFDEVKGYTERSDYAIINFESPIVKDAVDPIRKTGPHLCCDKKAMTSVRYAGFNCVTLANNHFYDFGEAGVRDTIAACTEEGLDYVGGGVNITESERILYKSVSGKSLAIINICENEWSIASPERGGSAPLNVVHNIQNIRKAKKSADWVLIIVHGGTEMYQYPSPRMKELYRFFIDEGADAIINHHQHCFSGYEYYKGKPIVYGLGNLCFDSDFRNSIWNEGYIVQVSLEEPQVSIELFPYIQCAEKPGILFLRDKNAFCKRIEEINQTIADDNALEQEFSKMALNKRELLLPFEPYNSKIGRILMRRHLLPSYFTPKKKDLVLNLFRCESYRDILFRLLANNSAE